MCGSAFVPSLHVGERFLPCLTPAAQPLPGAEGGGDVGPVLEVTYRTDALPPGSHSVRPSLVPISRLSVAGAELSGSNVASTAAWLRVKTVRSQDGARSPLKGRDCADPVWQLLQPGASASARLRAAWCFNGALLLVGFVCLAYLFLTFPGRSSREEIDARVGNADWDAALLAYLFSLLQSMVLLDGVKVLIITLVSPHVMPASHRPTKKPVTALRWLCRGFVSTLVTAIGAFS